MSVRLAAIALACSGCVVPYALPPLKGELGGSTMTGARPMFHAGGGAHIASGVLQKQQRFDVGAGGFADWDEDGLTTTAGYVDAAMFFDRSDHVRTSLGARGEVRWNADGSQGYGAKLRVEHEVFKPTNRGYSGVDRCAAVTGGAYGTGGVGMFAESGVVTSDPDGTIAWTATAGVTMRIPATVGVIFGIPGC